MRRVSRYLGGSVACTYLSALVVTRVAALRKARERGDLGASAIELAIITAIIAAAAVFVAMIIKNVVTNDANKIKGY